MSGYIKLHRGWRDNPVLTGDFSRADAWVWLIEQACWKPSRTRIKGETVNLARGELSFSQRFMADAWGWSKSRVDRFMADLRSEGMIATRSKIGATAGHSAGHGQAIITICNYAKYQDAVQSSWGNDVSQSGATAGQQRGKEEEGKKERKNNTRALARPDDVDEQVWLDWKKLRTAKRAPITETAISGIRREASKVGWSLNQALTESAANGWQGFKADWVGGVSREVEYTGP